ncbi:signal transducer/transcription protein, putative [Actinidia rufa]|uniref:Signal transducer/transcription protein, putative n=1 Tax=Actinidia rufa TaxID=165716 RepID=A0A7J0E4I5_9ERIC|nr:signal transducer/transcription protein, putative [Actinidia rufa]
MGSFSSQTCDPYPESDIFEYEGPRKKKNEKKKQVFLEGYVEASDEDNLTRTKSLTDEDLDELKGCLDLGFGFSYEEIPELCNTLPALELCYSMSQRFLDDQQKLPDAASETCSSGSGPIANWKISSPGE